MIMNNLSNNGDAPNQERKSSTATGVFVSGSASASGKVSSSQSLSRVGSCSKVVNNTSQRQYREQLFSATQTFKNSHAASKIPRGESEGNHHQVAVEIVPSTAGEHKNMFDGDKLQQTLYNQLFMRKQQMESTRTHLKISKPVRPEVADAFEADPFSLVESMRSDQTRGRVSHNGVMIASEKVSSPTIIRNRNIKTMTQLLGATSAAANADERISDGSMDNNHRQQQQLFRKQKENNYLQELPVNENSSYQAEIMPEQVIQQSCKEELSDYQHSTSSSKVQHQKMKKNYQDQKDGISGGNSSTCLGSARLNQEDKPQIPNGQYRIRTQQRFAAAQPNSSTILLKNRPSKQEKAGGARPKQKQQSLSIEPTLERIENLSQTQNSLRSSQAAKGGGSKLTSQGSSIQVVKGLNSTNTLGQLLVDSQTARSSTGVQETQTATLKKSNKTLQLHSKISINNTRTQNCRNKFETSPTIKATVTTFSASKTQNNTIFSNKSKKSTSTNEVKVSNNSRAMPTAFTSSQFAGNNLNNTTSSISLQPDHQQNNQQYNTSTTFSSAAQNSSALFMQSGKIHSGNRNSSNTVFNSSGGQLSSQNKMLTTQQSLLSKTQTQVNSSGVGISDRQSFHSKRSGLVDQTQHPSQSVKRKKTTNNNNKNNANVANAMLDLSQTSKPAMKPSFTTLIMDDDESSAIATPSPCSQQLKPSPSQPRINKDSNGTEVGGNTILASQHQNSTKLQNLLQRKEYTTSPPAQQPISSTFFKKYSSHNQILASQVFNNKDSQSSQQMQSQIKKQKLGAQSNSKQHNRANGSSQSTVEINSAKQIAMRVNSANHDHIQSQQSSSRVFAISRNANAKQPYHQEKSQKMQSNNSLAYNKNTGNVVSGHAAKQDGGCSDNSSATRMFATNSTLGGANGSAYQHIHRHSSQVAAAKGGLVNTGCKKEIKCVVTKQTKFNEERQQQLMVMHQQQIMQERSIEIPNVQGGNNSNNRAQSFKHNKVSRLKNQQSLSQSSMVEINSGKMPTSARLAEGGCSNKEEIRQQMMMKSTTTTTSNLMMTSSGSNSQKHHHPQPPVLAININMKEKVNSIKNTTTRPQTNQVKHHKNKQMESPDSSSKHQQQQVAEKQYRKHIVKKIKTQLTQVFDQGKSSSNHRNESSKLNQDFYAKHKSMTVSDSGLRQFNHQSRSKVAVQTILDDKLPSSVPRTPSLLVGRTPTSETNPHKPKKNSFQQKLQSVRTADPKRCLNFNSKGQSAKKITKIDKTQVFELSHFEIQKSSHTIEKDYDSPIHTNDSNYESQLSAPQEISSASQGSQLEKPSQGHNRGVILPQSVAEASKSKLANIQFGLQLDKQRDFKAYQSRNFNMKDSRFSQRVQRTLPNLIAAMPIERLIEREDSSPHNSTDEKIIKTNNNTQSREEIFNKYQTLGVIQNTAKDRRNTVYSDSLSQEMVRNNKPKFLKLQNKSTRLHQQVSGGDFQSATCVSLTRRMESDHTFNTGGGFGDFVTQGFNINVQNFNMVPQILNLDKQHRHVPSQPTFLQQNTLINNGTSSFAERSGHSIIMLKNSAPKASIGDINKQSTSSYIDLNALDQNIIKRDSPTQSENVVKQQQQFRGITIDKLHQNTDKKQNEKEQLTEESMTNDGAFSDSQFGDIPDEDNYNVQKEKSSSILLPDNGTNEESTIVLNYARQATAANITGKYSSCMNKNDQLSFQANKTTTTNRLNTIRTFNNNNNVSSYYHNDTAGNDGGNSRPMETAKQILSKKGSKCKCPIKSSSNLSLDQERFQKETKVCGNYCKHLSSRMQKKIVKKLLLEQFKSTVENALKSNQKLALAQIQNPFMLQANFGCLGDRKFLVSASWWSKWCDYVNWQTDEHGLPVQKGSFRDEMMCDTNEEMDLDGPVQGVQTVDMDLDEQKSRIDRILRLSIYKQSSFATLAEAIENETEQSQLFYERPGCIENQNLLVEEETYRNQINSTVVEHFDYEVVSHSLWQHLYSWYSADVTICRKLALDTMNKSGADNLNGMRVDLSQSMLSFQSVTSPQDSDRQHQFCVFLDLFPTKQTVYEIKNQLIDGNKKGESQRIMSRRIHECAIQSELDEIDEPNSNETTQILYKQQIEDGSSTTQFYLGTNTPEQHFNPQASKEIHHSSLKLKSASSPFRQVNHYQQYKSALPKDDKSANSNRNQHMMFTGSTKKQSQLLSQQCQPSSIRSRQSNMMRLEKVSRHTVGANPISSTQELWNFKQQPTAQISQFQAQQNNDNNDNINNTEELY